LIDTFFFDWDGTLNDSAQQAFKAMVAAFAAMGRTLEQEIYEQVYSPNWYAMFEKLRLPKELWEKADELWMQHYDYKASRLVPGARELIEELTLRGHTLGIVTSGNRERVQWEIDEFGLMHVFQAVICGEDVVNRKPHPEGLEFAMVLVKKSPECCCYVGDSPQDIEMGRRAGVRTVGIRSGYPGGQKLAQALPDRLFDSVREFIAALESRPT
jgi:HAD superfamily hydrolase (TIGR01509 family)